MQKFGDLLRRFRKEAGESMGSLARFLGVTTPYISDVERGYRTPLTDQRIRKTVEFLELNKKQGQDLMDAAAVSRGHFKLESTPSTPAKQALGAALARGWNDLDEAKAARMTEILEEDGG